MQDELLLRQWTASHSQLSDDLDRLVRKIRTRSPVSARPDPIIGLPYDTTNRRADPLLSSAANSLLSGLAAIVTTVTLFATAAVVAMPSTDHASPLRTSAVVTVGYELA